MSQSTSDPDPGWYPDFADPALERWWDGSAWSPVTRSAEAAAPAVSAASAVSNSRRSTLPDGEQPAPADGGQPDTTTHGGPGTTNPYASPPAWYTPEARPGGSPVRPVQGQPPPYGNPPLRHPIAGPTTPDGVPLALPWRRLVARLLDALITSVLTAAAGVYYLTQMWQLAEPQLRAAAAGTPGADLYPLLEDPAFIDAMLRYTFVGLLVGGVYSVVLTHLLGGTMGKLVVGIRVRSWDEAGRPAWGQALARWLTREVVAQITFAGIGSIYRIMDSVWLLRDPRRQCLHDKIPGTVVVQHR